MALAIGSVVINCSDIEAMTAFWTQALSLKAGPLSPEGDFRVLGGSKVNVSLQRALSPVSPTNHMHLDLYTAEQEEQVARLLEAGARLVRTHHDPDDDYVVLADPEGNHFCVCAVPPSYQLD